jgi:DNA invertase Pin-like site-specific DNA recombinase
MTETLRSREYLRVSRDKSGRVRSHDEQHDDNQRDADILKWMLLDTPYKDVGSASRHSTKVRGDFDALLADLENDRFGADVLQIWESSRGSRRVGEWVLLCDLLAERGVLVRVFTHGRTYDPRNGRDRRSLLEDAVDSEFEASKISERALRAAAASAEAGRPHGVLQFGFQRTYHPGTGRLVGQAHDLEKAPLVAELFTRLLALESLRRIQKDWASRGIVNGHGTPFSQQHLRMMALSPAYAGLRVVSGERQSNGHAAGPKYIDAIWDGIVSKADFFTVRDRLTNTSRKTSKDGRATHLLSMSTAARCDVCDGPISVRNSQYGQRYRCWHHGHVILDREELDEVAEAAILEYLRRPSAYAKLAREGEVVDEELRAVREEAAVVRAELKELAARVKSGGLSVTFAASVEPGLRERLMGMEKREQMLSAPVALHALIEPGKDVADRWASVPIEARRAIARIVLSRDMVGQIRVTRSPTPRTRVPVEDRIKFDLASDES